MTCGIDGDDEYSINPLPPILYQSKAEELQGRIIQQLDASQNFLMVVRMILSSFAENKTLAQLIPQPKESPSLKGRQIQQLDSSHSLIHRGISIPIIPKETTTFNLYQKDVIDLTSEAEKEIPEECSESELVLAPRQVFFKSHNSEGLSLEQLCERRGMILDLRTGQYIPCKSWLKKVGHSIEKNLRKGAKKTCKFVKEHKKEIIIAAGVLIVGGAIAGAVYYVVGAEVAKDVAGAAIIASASQFKDPPRRRREEGDTASSSDGPDPEDDTLPMPSVEPGVHFPENIASDIYSHIIPPIPKLDLGFNKQGTSLPPQPLQQSGITPPYIPTEIAPQQIFDKIFKPTPTPNPTLPIHHPDFFNHHKIQEPVPVAPLQVPEGASPSDPAPQNPPIKSPYGVYLDTLQSQVINPGYVPSLNPSYGEQKNIGSPSAPAGASNGAFTNIIQGLQQNLEIWGTGAIKNAKALENSSLQNPSESDIGRKTDQAREELTLNLEKIKNELIQGGFLDSSESSQSSSDLSPVNNAIMRFLGLMAYSGDTFTENPSAPHLVDYQSLLLPPEIISKCYEIAGIEKKGTEIIISNGMDNTLEFAKSNALHLQSLMPEKMKIHGIYNHTNGKATDLAEIFTLNYAGVSPITADLIKAKFTAFHEKNLHNPYAKILYFCHSQGAIHTKNALMDLPEEIRNRVIVVAIAPAAIVPRKLCFKSFNYMSKRDVVPYGEILYAFLSGGIEKALEKAHLHEEEMIKLEPLENATGLEHAFQSSIFIPVIQQHIDSYIIHNGEYR